jgi:hypothetical protein
LCEKDRERDYRSREKGGIVAAMDIEEGTTEINLAN